MFHNSRCIFYGAFHMSVSKFRGEDDRCQDLYNAWARQLDVRPTLKTGQVHLNL